MLSSCLFPAFISNRETLIGAHMESPLSAVELGTL